MKGLRILNRQERDKVARAMKDREKKFAGGIDSWARKANKRSDAYFDSRRQR